MKRMLAVCLAAALPLAAVALDGPGAWQGPGAGPGANRPTPEQHLKRMRLARTLGLAEVLDLDQAQALKLGDTLQKLDDKRLAALKQMRDAHDVLRRAAQGEKVSAADVDQAIARGLDARAQLQAVDRETVQAVTTGLSPEKKARAVLFLAKFEHRFGRGGGMGPGMGQGPGMQGRPGRGMGPGRGRGMGQGMGETGMGPGPADGPMMGMGPGCGGPDCPWSNEADE